MLVLCASVAVAVLDQVSKSVIRANLFLSEDRPVIPHFFSLSHVRNTGAAWGMMQGLNHWLVLLSVVMLAVIVIFRRHFLTDSLVHRISMGLMLGGIAGNVIDRIRLGYVVDFLDFYWRGHHFPSFNVADSAICVGVSVYILTQVLGHGRSTGEEPGEAGEPA